MATRVMVIEDHPLFRDAVESRITQMTEGPVEFVYSGASLSDALAAHSKQPTHCAILDLDLGDHRSPIANTSDLVEAGCRVLIVSALADPATVRASLRAGALGFISKQSAAAEFEEAFKATLAGEPSTSVDVAAILSGDDSVGVGLSERERTAMTLYASGMKIESVARRMNVKTTTAQEYIKRVRSKYLKAGTPVPTKTDLYRQAREEGLVP